MANENAAVVQRKLSRKERAQIIKNLAQYMKGAWRYAILAWLTVALEVVCEVLIPYLSQFIINIIMIFLN